MPMPWDRHPDRYRDDPVERRFEDRDDYGQADYSADYAYDPAARSGYSRDERDDRGPYEPRTWRGRSPDLRRDERRDRARLAVDHRILAIVTERLERDRRIDTSDVEITVEDGVVYLTGSARTREGKRRIENLVDVDGVSDVVNSLRVREPERHRGMFGF